MQIWTEELRVILNTNFTNETNCHEFLIRPAKFLNTLVVFGNKAGDDIFGGFDLVNETGGLTHFELAFFEIAFEDTFAFSF